MLLTMMALPVRWSARKSIPGFGEAGTFYPSIRLWTEKGTILPADTNNGWGAKVYTIVTDDDEDALDREAVRKWWRRFASRPVSYNWKRNLAEYQEVTTKAAEGPTGSIAKMMTARQPRNRWHLDEEDEEEDVEEEELRG